MDALKFENWNYLVSRLKKMPAWGVHFTTPENVLPASEWIEKNMSFDGHFFCADNSSSSYLDDDYYSNLFASINCGKYFSKALAYHKGKLQINSGISLFFATSSLPNYAFRLYKGPVYTHYGPTFDVGKNLHPQVFKFSTLALSREDLNGLEKTLEQSGNRTYASTFEGMDQLFDDTLETAIDLEILRKLEASVRY